MNVAIVVLEILCIARYDSMQPFSIDRLSRFFDFLAGSSACVPLEDFNCKLRESRPRYRCVFRFVW